MELASGTVALATGRQMRDGRFVTSAQRFKRPLETTLMLVLTRVNTDQSGKTLERSNL